jgi:hypothetical protein
MRGIKVKIIDGQLDFNDQCPFEQCDLMYISDYRKIIAEKDKIIEELIFSLGSFIDNDKCELDHHGECQMHGSFSNGGCIMLFARAILRKAREAE